MKKILFFLIFLICFQISAQHLPFRVYSSEDGLASNQVRFITQDKVGALWIGCGSGLSRFNGFGFENFGLKEGLPDISIEKIEAGEDGKVFVLTFKGIAYKNIDEDYFRAIPFDGNVTDFAYISKSFLHTDNLFLCSPDKGIFMYCIERGHTTYFGFKELRPFSIACFHGDILMSDRRGNIYFINIKNKKVRLIKSFKGQIRIKKASSDLFFLISDRSVYSLAKKDNLFSVENLFSTDDKTLVIYDVFLSTNNVLWIGTNKYLIKIENKEENYFTEKNGIPEFPVFSVYETSDGTLWVGSNSGLAKLVTSGMVVYQKLGRERIKECTCLYYDRVKDCIWTGSNRGVFIIKNDRSFRFKHAYLDQYVVWDIIRDDKGNYFFATEGGGVVKISISGQTTIYNKENNCLPDNRVTDLFFQKSTLYVATKNGFAVFADGRWRKFSNLESLGSGYIRAIDGDNKGNIFLATYGAGIVLYKNDQFLPVIANLRDEYSIIYAVKKSKDLLFGATNYGIIIVKNKIATLYGKESGFPEFSAIALLPEKDFIWVGLDRGLCLFDLKRKKVVQYFTKDEGLPGNEFTTHNAICVDGENRLWIGLFGGIATIDKESVFRNNVKFNPSLYLKSVKFKVGKRDVILKTEGGSAVLPYNARDIAFNIDIIWFKNEHSISVFYRLKGYDDEWKKLSEAKNAMVFLNSLPYGKYDLIVKIKTITGKEIKKDLINFVIKKPWWGNKWFILSMIIFLLMGGMLITSVITYYWTRHLQFEKERLNRIVEEKTEELRLTNEKLMKKNRLLRELAEKDYLTGLHNRRYAFKAIRFYQKLADRDPDFKLSFILIDIDFFKVINDTYGHDAGDFVLKSLAKLLKRHTRKSDVVSRWGGEEFLIILPKTGLEGAKKTAEKLRRMVEHLDLDYNGQKIKFTISVGVASMDLSRSSTDKDVERVLLDVDEKLYKAKQSGRNLIVF